MASHALHNRCGAHASCAPANSTNLPKGRGSSRCQRQPSIHWSFNPVLEHAWSSKAHKSKSFALGASGPSTGDSLARIRPDRLRQPRAHTSRLCSSCIVGRTTRCWEPWAPLLPQKHEEGSRECSGARHECCCRTGAAASREAPPPGGRRPQPSNCARPQACDITSVQCRSGPAPNQASGITQWPRRV